MHTRSLSLSLAFSLFALVVACGGTDGTDDSGSSDGAGGSAGDGSAGDAGGPAKPSGGASGQAGAPTAGKGGSAPSAGTSGSSGKSGAGSAGKSGAGGAPCKTDGQTASSSSQCCGKQLDDFGACCTGKGCCSAVNHSQKTADGKCGCLPGYDWATTDPADFSCVLEKDHVVTCTGVGHVNPTWCTCTGDANGGKTKIVGSCTKDPSFAPMTCCADAGFPDAGSCSCFLSQAWRCLAFSGECSCSYYWDKDAVQYTTTVCDAVPEPNGTPWRCCKSKFGSCGCKANGPACAADETEVKDCASDVKIGLQPFKGCAAGQKSVGGCSNVGAGGAGNCTKDAQCGTECTGTDPVCCPICDAGTCKVTCCSSNGVCF